MNRARLMKSCSYESIESFKHFCHAGNRPADNIAKPRCCIRNGTDGTLHGIASAAQHTAGTRDCAARKVARIAQGAACA